MPSVFNLHETLSRCVLWNSRQVCSVCLPFCLPRSHGRCPQHWARRFIFFSTCYWPRRFLPSLPWVDRSNVWPPPPPRTPLTLPEPNVSSYSWRPCGMRGSSAAVMSNSHWYISRGGRKQAECDDRMNWLSFLFGLREILEEKTFYYNTRFWWPYDTLSPPLSYICLIWDEQLSSKLHQISHKQKGSFP